MPLDLEELQGGHPAMVLRGFQNAMLNTLAWLTQCVLSMSGWFGGDWSVCIQDSTGKYSKTKLQTSWYTSLSKGKRHQGSVYQPLLPVSSKHGNKLGSSIWRASQATDTSSVGSLLLQECVPLTLPGVWKAVKEQLRKTTDSMHNEHGLGALFNLKRHCQELKVKNQTKHALFLSDLNIW